MVLQRSVTALRQHLHQVSPGPSPRVVPVWPWGVFHGCARSITRAHDQFLPHLSQAGAALLHVVPQVVQPMLGACAYGLCVWVFSGHCLVMKVIDPGRWWVLCDQGVMSGFFLGWFELLVW